MSDSDEDQFYERTQTQRNTRFVLPSDDEEDNGGVSLLIC